MIRVMASARVGVLLVLVACAGEIQNSTSPAEQGGNTAPQAGRAGAPLTAAGTTARGGAGASAAGGATGAAGLAAVGGGRSAGAGAGVGGRSGGAGTIAAGRSAVAGTSGTAGRSGEAGSSGSSAGRGGGSGAPTFTEVYEQLVFGCNGCHAAGMGGLRMMTQEEAYMNLVDVTSRSCSGLKRVQPGDPSKSLVYLAITRVGMSGSCKVPSMPPGNIPWLQENVDMVKAWIQAGAKDD